MTNIVTITTPEESLTCQRGHGVSISFTVNNTTDSLLRCGSVVKASSPDVVSWCKIEGKPERTLQTNEVDTFNVSIEIPEKLAEGKYLLRLVIFETERPGEYFTEGPWVSVNVPSLLEKEDKDKKRKKRGVPIWVIASLVGAIIVVGGGLAAWLLSGSTIPDVIGKSKRTAVELIEKEGFLIGRIEEETTGTKQAGFVLRQDPVGGTDAEPQTKVDLVIESGTPFLILGNSRWGDAIW